MKPLTKHFKNESKKLFRNSHFNTELSLVMGISTPVNKLVLSSTGISLYSSEQTKSHEKLCSDYYDQQKLNGSNIESCF